VDFMSYLNNRLAKSSLWEAKLSFQVCKVGILFVILQAERATGAKVYIVDGIKVVVR